MSFTKNDTNAIKGIAIIMMMFHHCFLSADRYAGYDIDFSFLGEYYTVMLSSFCKICVSIFVFISGYGISLSLKRLETKDYPLQVKKRYISLMSGFWFIYILSFVAALIFDRSILSVYKGNNFIDGIFFAFCDFMGLAELFGTPMMIGTWWYMSLALVIIATGPV